MSAHTEGIQRLIDLFGSFPGIGARTAERMAYHVLRQDPQQSRSLSDAIDHVLTDVGSCTLCYNYAEGERCTICLDPTREKNIVCVVEHESDVISIEKTGVHKGVYHVLQGRIAPLSGVGPGDVNIAELITRVTRDGITEVILATNPTMEGDTTANYIREQLLPSGIRVTRLARGLPAGSNLEYASKAIVSDALEGRTEL